MDFININFEGNIATISINRPKALNALNTTMLSELKYALAKLEKDESLRVLLITGEGKAFVAGADIKEMSNKTKEEATAFSQLGHVVFAKIENFKRPVIAAVNGFALGGGLELALACDFIVASEKAKFSAPEVNLGLIPGFNGTQRLARRIGINLAKYMIFTAKMLSAEEALNVGLVQVLTKENELLSTAGEIAKTIANKGKNAIAEAKAAINYGWSSGAEKGSKFEIEAFGNLFAGTEAKEGMKAFLEKRKPNWK